MPNLRATWVSTEESGQKDHRPLCQNYTMAEGYCEARVTHYVTLRVSYDCCKSPCACEPYVTLKVCREHARRYGPVKGELQEAV